MPTGTKVDSVYQALRRKGYSEGAAARIAQAQTGEALATGRPPKGKGMSGDQHLDWLMPGSVDPNQEGQTGHQDLK